MSEDAQSLTDPFGVTPDREAYVPRRATEDALIALERHVLDGSTAVALVGPSGIGKTLLLRVLATRLAGHLRTVHVPYSALPEDEISPWILGLMGESAGEQPDAELAALAGALERDGGGLAILIDDAGSMPLATVRRLASVAEQAQGALHLVVALLDDERAQEIVEALGAGEVRFDAPMDTTETGAYVRVRFARAGISHDTRARFDAVALQWVQRESNGNPRLVNDRALEWLRRLRGLDTPGNGVFEESREPVPAAAAAAAHPPAAPQAPAPPTPTPEPPPAEAARPSAPPAAQETRPPARETPLPAAAMRPRPAPDRSGARIGVMAAAAAGLVALGFLFGRWSGPEATPDVSAPASRSAAAAPAPTSPAQPAAPDPAATALPHVSSPPPPAVPAETQAAAPDRAPTPAASPTVEPVPIDSIPVRRVEPAPETAIAAEPAPTPVPETARAEDAVTRSADSGTPPATEAPAASAPVQVAALAEVGDAGAGVDEGATAEVAEPELFFVNVNARPWARISIDGVEVGVTPLAKLPVEPGYHRFRATLPDGRIIERSERIGELNQRVTFP